MDMLRRLYNKIRNYLSRKKPAFYYAVFTLIGVASFSPIVTQAQTLTGAGAWILRILLWVFYLIFVAIMGKIATLAMRMLVWITTFSGFTTGEAVTAAWTVVRDFCNLGFVVILLVIAFGTILKLESYSYKKLLPKMIVAAVLINFSKLICGVIVDASQIVMLTFVNAFKDAATQGLYHVFRLGDLVSMGFTMRSVGAANETGSGAAWTELDYLMTTISAGAMITFMAVLLIAFSVILLFRVVIIWTLTVLSPIAWVTSILPATQKYSQKWWDTFTRYVVLGPLLAFFIWLSLFIVTKAGDSGVASTLSYSDGSVSTRSENISATTNIAVSEADIENGISPAVITNFLIGVVLLMVGLQFSQEMASEVGGYVSKFSGMPKAFAGKFWSGSGKFSKFVAGGINDRLVERGMPDLNVNRQIEKVKHVIDRDSKTRQDRGRAVHQEWARQGRFLSADHAYEALFGIGDQLGVSGKQGLLRRRSTYKNFEAARQTESALEQQKNERIAAAVGKDPSVYDEEIARRKRIDNLEDVDMHMMNGDIDSADAPLVIAALRSAKEKTTDPDKQQAIEEEIKRIEKASATAGTFDVRGGLRVDVSDNLMKRRERYEAERKEAGITPEVSAAIDSVSSAIKPLEEQIHAQREIMHENAPEVDPEQARLARNMASEASKDIETDNEHDLQDQLRQALHNKNLFRALGIVSHMSKVGHPNEIVEVLNEFFGKKGESRVNNNGQGLIEGVQRMFVGKLGGQEQMVLTILDDMARAAKGNHQWAFSEMVGSKNGRLYAREEPERQERIFYEMSKKNLVSEMQAGNRLAHGGYRITDRFGTQSWEGPMAGVAALMTRNIEKITDAVSRGYHNFNDNSQLFYMNNPHYIEAMEQGLKGNEEAIKSLRIALLGLSQKQVSEGGKFASLVNGDLHSLLEAVKQSRSGGAGVPSSVDSFVKRFS
ncbi:MAG: hypothetical protein WC752_02065 [Patescibacteria group bacterium]|jgi:hypothetical protein